MFMMLMASSDEMDTNHDGAIIERRIVDHRPRVIAVGEGRGVDKGLHRRACGPFRLQGPIILIMLEIASTDEDEDSGPVRT